MSIWANKNNGPVVSVCINNDKTLIASGGADHSVRLWNLKTKTLLWKTHSYLQAEALSLKGCQDLSKINKLLLQQKGAFLDKPTENKREKITWLGNMGHAYSDLGQIEKAIDSYEQALAISKESGYRQAEGTCLWCLGIVFIDLNQKEKAKKYLMDSLAIYEEIKSSDAKMIRRWLATLETKSSIK